MLYHNPLSSTGARVKGCPLSPLLFALALEPLAASIRNYPDFPGLQIHESTHKNVLYADDALVLVTQPQQSIPVLFKTINQFSLLFGYRVNWAKSGALTLFTPDNFTWPQSGIKYLGILFPRSLSDLIRVNFEPLLERFKRLCNKFMLNNKRPRMKLKKLLKHIRVDWGFQT